MAAFFMVLGCAAQHSQDDNPMAVRLSDAQQSLYDTVIAFCNSEEKLYFADYEFAQDWEGYQTELNAAKFITYLLRVDESNQGDSRNNN